MMLKALSPMTHDLPRRRCSVRWAKRNFRMRVISSNSRPEPEPRTARHELEWRRDMRRVGVRASGLVLAVAACGVVATGHLPAATPQTQAGAAVVSAAALSAAALSRTQYRSWQLGEVLNVEVCAGRLYVQRGRELVGGPRVAAGDVVVRHTGDARGRGAFASVALPEGAWVCDYEGDTLSNIDFFERYPSGMADYCMGLDNDTVLDAAAVCVGDSFSAGHVNHSRARHNLVRWTHRGERRISFYTTRPIQPGEELLLDYGRRYWSGREQYELD